MGMYILTVEDEEKPEQLAERKLLHGVLQIPVLIFLVCQRMTRMETLRLHLIGIWRMLLICV